MSSWEDTVMSDDERMVALTDLQMRAISGEDIRWDKVSEVTAQAQAEISFKVGYETAEEELGKCYAPTFNDGKKAGRKKVIEWIKNNAPVAFRRLDRWQAKLKDWGIEQ